MDMSENQDTKDKRAVARKKARQFKKYAQEYRKKKEKVLMGLEMTEEIRKNRRRIMDAMGASDEQWDDWHWQLKNRIADSESLNKIFKLSDKERKDFDRINEKFRWAFTPYFASLMDPEDRECPVRRQMVPDILEMEMTGVPDFSGEEYTSPVKNLVRWYPDRVAVHVTNVCAAFCRHCLRRRKIGEIDKAAPDEEMENIFEYLAENKEIRDVLFTGGDPFTFSTNKIDRLLSRLDEIGHIEIKRIGSRVPITMPQRIDDDLCDMLATHHPFYVNIQANHPKEITEDSKEALRKLSRAGIPLGNQSVLMKGINDSPTIIMALNHELLKARVKPYYLYHCQGTIGIEHFRTPVETGIEIMEHLRGYTSGMAVPDYIITPSGFGKTPLAPEYQISSGPGHVLLRNWEGIVYEYENPKPDDC